MTLEPRPMPDETLRGLSPPLPGFPYFAHAVERPFEPAAVNDCPANAWWLADASFLAYGSPAFVEGSFQASPLPSLGFHLDWLGEPESSRGLVLGREDVLILVFRGTRLRVQGLLDIAEVALLNQNDLWIDAQFLPAVHRAGGKVHGGFLRTFGEIRSQLDEHVGARRPGQALWLAGHSMGGALATLAAAHLGPEQVQGLHTYGCPRVGDPAFCGMLPTRSHFRFVHRDDWVPSLPPELLGYAHAGQLRPVTGSPPRKPLEDMARAVRELAAGLRNLVGETSPSPVELPIPFSGIADHMPVYYATLLWNALLAA